MIIAVGNDSQFRQFVKAGGQEQLADDARFADNPSRVAHRAILVPLLTEMTKTKTKNDWIATLEKANVPCGPINDLKEVFANEQVVSRQVELQVPHPTAGTMKLVASPMKLSATPVEVRMAPPTLGQHTDEVLRERLGLSAEAISVLRQKQVI
jgi:formyl-CoA transferase